MSDISENVNTVVKKGSVCARKWIWVDKTSDKRASRKQDQDVHFHKWQGHPRPCTADNEDPAISHHTASLSRSSSRWSAALYKRDDDDASISIAESLMFPPILQLSRFFEVGIENPQCGTCVKMRSGPTMKWKIMNFWYCEFCLSIILLFFHILVCISVTGVTKMVFICLLMMI